MAGGYPRFGRRPPVKLFSIPPGLENHGPSILVQLQIRHFLLVDARQFSIRLYRFGIWQAATSLHDRRGHENRPSGCAGKHIRCDDLSGRSFRAGEECSGVRAISHQWRGSTTGAWNLGSRVSRAVGLIRDQALRVGPHSFPAHVSLLDVRTGERKPWLNTMPPDPAGLLYANLFLTPDGKSYAYRYRRVLSTLYVTDGLR